MELDFTCSSVRTTSGTAVLTWLRKSFSSKTRTANRRRRFRDLFGFGAGQQRLTDLDGLDPNVAFGAFTDEKEQTGTDQNPAREIDLAEISRWGHPAAQGRSDSCPSYARGMLSSRFKNTRLCPLIRTFVATR